MKPPALMLVALAAVHLHQLRLQPPQQAQHLLHHHRLPLLHLQRLRLLSWPLVRPLKPGRRLTSTRSRTKTAA